MEDWLELRLKNSSSCQNICQMPSLFWVAFPSCPCCNRSHLIHFPKILSHSPRHSKDIDILGPVLRTDCLLQLFGKNCPNSLLAYWASLYPRYVGLNLFIHSEFIYSLLNSFIHSFLPLKNHTFHNCSGDPTPWYLISSFHIILGEIVCWPVRVARTKLACINSS